MANQVKIACKNVFKNQDEKERRKEFTQKWTKIINQAEDRVSKVDKISINAL